MCDGHGSDVSQAGRLLILTRSCEVPIPGFRVIVRRVFRRVTTSIARILP